MFILAQHLVYLDHVITINHDFKHLLAKSDHVTALLKILKYSPSNRLYRYVWTK